MNTIKSKGKVEPIDRLVSNRLKLRRITCGVTQKTLAIVAGVTIQQIQKYESAVNRVPTGKLYNLSKFLQVPINYFFDLDNKDG